MSEEIIGTWETDPEDVKSQQVYGKVYMEFKTTGELIYTIQLKGKVQKMFMTYEIKGDRLVTNQTSAQQKEETEYKILSDGKLELGFGGVKSKYLKVKE